METTLGDLAGLVGGTVTRGDRTHPIRGFASIDDAREDDLTFFGNERYLTALKKSRAGAVLAPKGFGDQASKVAGVIEVESPSAAFAVVVKEFGVAPRPFVAGIHPTAVIAEGVTIDLEKVAVGAQVVIEEGCSIGEGTHLGHGSVICAGTRIGEDCLIHPNVTIREGSVLGARVIIHSGCVIGADGFGYEIEGGTFRKIDQVGIVELGDEVEIGACSTIDRARFGATRIGSGTKIDNLVHIAHNCVIGQNAAFAAQVGVSGSTRIGSYVMMGGKSAASGHLDIGDKAVIMGKAGVTKDVPAGTKVMGFPAEPYRLATKRMASQRKLPELVEKMKRLEAELESLKGAIQKDGD